MSSENIREIFEKTAPNKIIKFGDRRLKTSFNGMVTQYDYAHHMSSSSANHKTDSEIVSGIIYLLEGFCEMYPTRKQRVKAVAKNIVVTVLVIGLSITICLTHFVD